jgi:hypothetical protein
MCAVQHAHTTRRLPRVHHAHPMPGSSWCSSRTPRS